MKEGKDCQEKVLEIDWNLKEAEALPGEPLYIRFLEELPTHYLTDEGHAVFPGMSLTKDGYLERVNLVFKDYRKNKTEDGRKKV